MPILLRVGHVSDFEPGTCERVKVRGRRLWLCNRDGVIRAFGTRCVHAATADDAGTEPCEHYRAQVRGVYVYVALDAVANDAPADIHRSDAAPEPKLS